MAAKIPFDQVSDKGVMIDHNKERGEGEEIVLHEDGNPWSVSNMLTGKAHEKFNEIPAQYFGMQENHLHALAKPSELDEQLRLSFWDEYFICIDAKKTIDLKKVYGKLCTRDYFYKTVLDVPSKFAFILQPPQQYTYRMRSLLNLGHKRLRQVLEMPLKDGKNVPNVKLISEIVKIVVMLENRVHGSVVQKIDVKQQSKSLNVNVNQNSNANINDKEVDELARIEREIAQLEKVALPPASDEPSFIDVKPIEQSKEAAGIKTEKE
jgi:hypothetical protein